MYFLFLTRFYCRGVIPLQNGGSPTSFGEVTGPWEDRILLWSLITEVSLTQLLSTTLFPAVGIHLCKKIKCMQSLQTFHLFTSSPSSCLRLSRVVSLDLTCLCWMSAWWRWIQGSHQFYFQTTLKCESRLADGKIFSPRHKADRRPTLTNPALLSLCSSPASLLREKTPLFYSLLWLSLAVFSCLLMNLSLTKLTISASHIH